MPGRIFRSIVNRAIHGRHLRTAKGYFTVTVPTNGTTAVNVFGADGAPCPLSITGVASIARDTTAGNITFTNGGQTVSTIAKGVTAGALVGAATLANQTVAAGAACSVVSSTAGNSFLLITFEVL